MELKLNRVETRPCLLYRYKGLLLISLMSVLMMHAERIGYYATALFVVGVFTVRDSASNHTRPKGSGVRFSAISSGLIDDPRTLHMGVALSQFYLFYLILSHSSLSQAAGHAVVFIYIITSCISFYVTFAKNRRWHLCYALLESRRSSKPSRRNKAAAAVVIFIAFDALLIYCAAFTPDAAKELMFVASALEFLALAMVQVHSFYSAATHASSAPRSPQISL